MKKLIIVSTFLFLQSCFTTDKNIVIIDGVNFVIPNGFERLQPSEEKKEILILKYKDEMHITVQNDLSETIKNNPLGNEFSMNYAHTIKFGMFKNAYKGYNISKVKKYKINGRQVIEQDFDAKVYFGEVYYKFYIVETSNIFLEILISGRKNLENEQKNICAGFMKNIDHQK